MATPGRYLPIEILRRIERLAREKKTQIAIAGECGISRDTVRKHWPQDVEKPPRGRPKAKLG